MEQILLAYGLPKETVAAIMILYKNTKVKVRSPDGDTDYFEIVAGVLRGDTKFKKLATVVEGDQKAPFSILLHRGVGEGATPFPGLLHFTLDSYLILLSVKQGGFMYHFKSLWYDVNWDWNQVSRTIGEHSTHGPMRRYTHSSPIPVYHLSRLRRYIKIWFIFLFFDSDDCV